MAAYERSDELAKLISVKHEILQQLRELSRRQIEIVESTDMDPAWNILPAIVQIRSVLRVDHHQLRSEWGVCLEPI